MGLAAPTRSPLRLPRVAFHSTRHALLSLPVPAATDMSPELFYSDGIHSFASDLWAFGCLAYELATGRPPFYSKSLEEVVTHILEADPRPLCTNDASDADGDGATPPLHRFSREFEHLVLRCLEKDPARRITWPELRAHPFWRESPSRLPELDLPDQPVFTRLFMGEENGADADGPPSVGASANLNSTLRRSGPPDVLRLSSQAKRNRITEHTESVRASAAAASAVAPVASLRSVAPSSSSAAVVEDEIPENLDGTVADLTLPSYDVEVDFSSTQPTDTDSRRVAPLPPVAGAQPPPQPVSRPVTSNNSARLLREPTRSARPTAELDAMEAQLARLHAREEEEEDVEVDDDDEDEEDRPDDFEPPPEQDDDEDETWHPDGTATFSAHHALDDVDDEEESYAEAIALNPRSASGSARRRQEDAQEESEPRPSAFALARHTTPALRLPQANYGPSTQPGTPLAAVAARKGSAGASRLPVLAPRAATAATTSTSAAPARKPVIKTTSSTSSSSAATTTRTASRKKPASSSSSSSVTTSHRALTTPLATRTPGGSSTTSTASRTRSTSATTKPTSSSRPSPTDQRLAWPERERP